MTPLRAYLDHHPETGARVYVDPGATVIGRVRLGDDVSVWPNAVLRGDVNHITVSDRTNLQDGCIGHVTHDGPHTPGGWPLVIGEDVTVGHGAILHGCRIGDRCLIGMGALVMDGAIIGDDVLVAAGSLVAPGHRLDPGYLYRGRPAAPVRMLGEDELAMLRYSAAHYVRLKDQYLGA